MKARVFSGHRPTGLIHLGHLVGALSNWISMQDEYDCFFAIVDWHALTTAYEDTSRIRDYVLETVADWIAEGLDPKKCTLFVQSDVKEHAEMHVLLSMVTPLTWLRDLPTYKEQIRQLAGRNLDTYGFLGYPVLQASDIVLYRADLVPVGEDQVPHVELTRDIARKFNSLYGEVLVEPQAKLTKVARLRGTDGRKMSKSFGNAILLSDDPGTIASKLKTMMTDPARVRRHDPGDPDKCPVFDSHRAFTSPDRLAEIDRGCRTAGIGCIDCKSDLARRLDGRFAALRVRRRELLDRPDVLRDVLADGARRARAVASRTVEAARAAMGIGDAR